VRERVIFTPSLLSADFSNLREEIEKCQIAGAQRLHVDVMDGHFVPNITIGPVVVESIRKVTSLALDIHLMIERPEQYIDDFINAGADLITFHVEEYRGEKSLPPEEGVYPRVTIDMNEERVKEVIVRIKTKGVRAAVALNPPTPFFVHNLSDELDEILIMTVNPGFGGQRLIPSTLDKVKKARSLFQKDIKVDGGVNEDTIKELVEAGANILVVGSYFFHSKDPKEALNRLSSLARGASN